MPQADLSKTQDMSGDPIAVTLVGTDSAKNLIFASQQGVVLIGGGDAISPTEYFRTLGLQPDVTVNIWMTVIIINCLENPLRMVGQSVIHGRQVKYPAASDLVGPFVEWTMGSNSNGRPGGRLCPHEIPAMQPDPIQPGSILYGVGAYYYGQANSASLYGGSGALQFSYSDDDASPYIGIAWMAPYTFAGPPSPGCAVTADMANYNSDVSAFCLATADKAQQIRMDFGKNLTVWGTLGNAVGGDTLGPAGATGQYQDGWVLTVSVRPK